MSTIECGRLDQLTDKIDSTLGGKSNSNFPEQLLSVSVRFGQSVELGPALWTQLKKDVPFLKAPQSPQYGKATDTAKHAFLYCTSYRDIYGLK